MGGRGEIVLSLMMKVTSLVLAMVAVSGTAMALDYEKDIVPLLKAHCYECHSNAEGKTKGNLVLDDIEEMRDYQVGKFSLIRPGNAEESQFLDLMKLPANDSDAMPPKGDRMPEKDLKIIEQWVMEGATIAGMTRNLEGEEVAMVKSSTGGEKEKAALDANSAPEFLTWTNTEGREIEARFVKLAGEAVTLVMRDGKSYPYPLTKLSAESQAQAKKLGSAAATGDK